MARQGANHLLLQRGTGLTHDYPLLLCNLFLRAPVGAVPGAAGRGQCVHRLEVPEVFALKELGPMFHSPTPTSAAARLSWAVCCRMKV